MTTINNQQSSILRLDIIKWGKVIAHIYNLNELSYDRTINLLSTGHTIKPIVAQANKKE